MKYLSANYYNSEKKEKKKKVPHRKYDSGRNTGAYEHKEQVLCNSYLIKF